MSEIWVVYVRLYVKTDIQQPAARGIKPLPAASLAESVKLVSQSSTVQAINKMVAATPAKVVARIRSGRHKWSGTVQAQMQARYQARLCEEDLDAGVVGESADLWFCLVWEEKLYYVLMFAPRILVPC